MTSSISPKQPSLRLHRDWYPYYAGFTERFVHSVVENHLADAELILDPWSGTGTTTAVCLKRGLSSRGIDINPALTVIARARLLSTQNRTRLEKLGAQVIDLAVRTEDTVFVDNDPLDNWFFPRGVRKIRSIQNALHLLLARNPTSPSRWGIADLVDEMSDTLSFFYCVLFAVSRGLLSKYGTTNPMWVKNPSSLRNRLDPSWDTLIDAFVNNIQHFRDRLSINHKVPEKSIFGTGNATELPFASNKFDGVVTSPPYATRIDYVIGTLPELSILGADESFVLELRQVTTGTPVVKNAAVDDRYELETDCGYKVLEVISAHSSKGSKSYYFPWFRNYLLNLQAGISELSRTVKPDGTICIVVQDSFYKEYRIDLQTIVVEIMASIGRALTDRRNFPAPSARSKAKFTSRQSPDRDTIESLLVFQ